MHSPFFYFAGPFFFSPGPEVFCVSFRFFRTHSRKITFFPLAMPPIPEEFGVNNFFFSQRIPISVVVHLLFVPLAVLSWDVFPPFDPVSLAFFLIPCFTRSNGTPPFFLSCSHNGIKSSGCFIAFSRTGFHSFFFDPGFPPHGPRTTPPPVGSIPIIPLNLLRMNTFQLHSFCLFPHRFFPQYETSLQSPPFTPFINILPTLPNGQEPPFPQTFYLAKDPPYLPFFAITFFSSGSPSPFSPFCVTLPPCFLV